MSGEKEFGDHDQAADRWLPAGTRRKERRPHPDEICHQHNAHPDISEMYACALCVL